MTLGNIVRAALATVAISTASAKLATHEESSTIFNEQLGKYAEGVENDVIEVSNDIIESANNKNDLTTYVVELPSHELICGIHVPIKDNIFDFEIHRKSKKETPFIVLDILTGKGKLTQRFIDYPRYGSVDHGESVIEGWFGFDTKYEYDIRAGLMKDNITHSIVPMSQSKIDLIERTYGSCVRAIRDYVRENK